MQRQPQHAHALLLLHVALIEQPTGISFVGPEDSRIGRRDTGLPRLRKRIRCLPLLERENPVQGAQRARRHHHARHDMPLRHNDPARHHGQHGQTRGAHALGVAQHQTMPSRSRPGGQHAHLGRRQRITQLLLPLRPLHRLHHDGLDPGLHQQPSRRPPSPRRRQHLSSGQHGHQQRHPGHYAVSFHVVLPQ